MSSRNRSSGNRSTSRGRSNNTNNEDEEAKHAQDGPVWNGSTAAHRAMQSVMKVGRRLGSLFPVPHTTRRASCQNPKQTLDRIQVKLLPESRSQACQTPGPSLVRFHFQAETGKQEMHIRKVRRWTERVPAVISIKSFTPSALESDRIRMWHAISSRTCVKHAPSPVSDTRFQP
eukprot:3181172-Rhodomonas_salina.4